MFGFGYISFNFLGPRFPSVMRVIPSVPWRMRGYVVSPSAGPGARKTLGKWPQLPFYYRVFLSMHDICPSFITSAEFDTFLSCFQAQQKFVRLCDSEPSSVPICTSSSSGPWPLLPTLLLFPSFTHLYSSLLLVFLPQLCICQTSHC